MDEKLWKLMLFLRRSKMGEIIVKLIYNVGIVTLYNYFALEHERKYPTEEMRTSKIFFGGGAK